MARQRIEVANFNDFTGGLNLRADPFQLADNESPDLLNVDVDPRGGFRQRKTAQFFNQDLGGYPPDIWTYEKTTGTKAVMARVGSFMYTSSGGNFTFAFSTLDVRNRAAVFKDNCYVLRSGFAPARWDGTTATALGQTYNDTDVPNGGDMPMADCIAVWMGCVWVANTLEGGVRFANRVRFSHPNFGEDYKSFHFFDVETGSDGDVITGLVPFGDRLLIFKQRSIHAVYGADPDSFGVYPVSREVGAISQEAIVSTDVGVYFFSWPDGVFHYAGGEPRNVFERIYPAILDGTIPDAYSSKITLGWGNRRLWVSVPWGSGATAANRCLVLDPSLGGTKSVGSWVAYDLAVGPFVEWRPPGADAILLAAAVGRNRVLKLDQPGSADDFGAGAEHITSYYRTRFFDLGQPAIDKRWRRADFVMRAGITAETSVDCFMNYDPSDAARTFRVNSLADPAAIVWGTGVWDTGAWGREGVTERNEIERGVPLGTARSVSLRFNGPATNAEWGINAISMKYVPRKVKG